MTADDFVVKERKEVADRQKKWMREDCGSTWARDPETLRTHVLTFGSSRGMTLQQPGVTLKPEPVTKERGKV